MCTLHQMLPHMKVQKKNPKSLWHLIELGPMQTNYSYLTRVYAEEREIGNSRVKDDVGLDAIAYEPDITIYNFTK